MGSTNIRQWNPGANNQATDEEWLVDALRTGGAPVGSLFPSKTGNKLFHQLTTMAAALGQALADKGYDVSDADLTTLTAVMANIRTRDVGIRDSFRNLLAYNNTANPTYKVDVSCDEAILQDASGNAVRISNVSFTYDLTVHLDGGSETNSVWYHLWLFSKEDGSYTGRFSLSATAPAAPSGYTFKAYVGAWYNGSDGNLVGARQTGRRVDLYTFNRELTNGTETTYTSLTVRVPVTARVWTGHLSIYANNGMGCGFLAVNADGIGSMPLAGYCTATGVAFQTPIECAIGTPQTIFYRIQVSGYSTTGATVETGGWEY